ncbi:MAG TPA: efflux RND transporter periplasmic adaptor subunit [Planctomycetota bacterium]|nr:efflux RND transporter periplasmic adaptor subunit [Planctomycetota bacterium]
MSETTPTKPQRWPTRAVERLKHWALTAWQKAGPATLVGLLVIGFALGYWLAPRRAAAPRPASEKKEEEAPAQHVRIWTCSMHPQIRQPKPGLCPICAMELIPLVEEPQEEGTSLRRFVTTEAARKLMQVETSPVERKFVSATVRMVGKVDYDEARLAYITAWVAGRIDRLYVDFTGITVRPGDHMVYIYSPDLRTSQEEFLIAYRHWQAAKQSGDADNITSAQAILDATRKKLELWGILPAQIEQLQKSGRADDHVTIYAPVGGIVIHKNAQEGMYVQTGTRIYTIADLSQVWVKLDAYESDLLWVRYGQEVAFTTEAYPGEEFRGRISFIDPVLNAKTRTVKVRVDVPNAAGKLKPEMFVRAVVQARVAAGGRVMSPDLSGKWMCPMHPSIVKDVAGKCDICEMPLVPTESLGYVPVHEVEAAQPLVIPASAPLITGTRAIVYIEVPDAKKPTFVGRQVVLGPRAGDYYLVRHGLQEGERVVTQGNFRIDSALQILARPSMMSPDTEGAAAPTEGMQVPAGFRAQLRTLQSAHAALAGSIAAEDLDKVRAAFRALGDALDKVDAAALTGQALLQWNELAMLLKNDSVVGATAQDLKAAREEAAALKGHLARLEEHFGLATGAPARVVEAPAAFKAQLAKVLEGYFAVQTALAGDDLIAAVAAVQQAAKAVDAVDMKALAPEAHMAWMRELPSLRKAIEETQGGKDIVKARAGFALLSDEMARLVRVFGLAAERPIHILHCPMAFNNRGANWLQLDTEVRNPYFGAAMFRCGEVTETLAAPSQGDGGARNEHP